MYTQARSGNLPDVYVQDEKYFKEYADEIRALFSSDIGFLSQVGIHVRRGDYVDNPFYVDLSETGYYEEAMGRFPDRDFLVFSDDTDFCRHYFRDNKRVQVMGGQTEIEDFNMLASCESIIMANSSFSWWAAWLCPNPAKEIIAPKRWHPDGIERTKIPDTWTRI